MKKWILMIFRIGSLLEQLTDRLDRRVERLALDPFGQTARQYERILELIDKKRRLVNLKVMREMLAHELAADDVFLLAKYAFGMSAAQIAELTNRRESTVYKRLRAALTKAEKTLLAAGYDEARLEREYSEFPIVKNTVGLFSRRVKKSVSAGSGAVGSGAEGATGSEITENNHIRYDILPFMRDVSAYGTAETL